MLFLSQTIEEVSSHIRDSDETLQSQEKNNTFVALRSVETRKMSRPGNPAMAGGHRSAAVVFPGLDIVRPERRIIPRISGNSTSSWSENIRRPVLRLWFNLLRRPSIRTGTVKRWSSFSSRSSTLHRSASLIIHRVLNVIVFRFVSVLNGSLHSIVLKTNWRYFPFDRSTVLVAENQSSHYGHDNLEFHAFKLSQYIVIMTLTKLRIQDWM